MTDTGQRPPLPLPWPPEHVPGAGPAVRFDVPPTNLVLDLHGSPQDPDLVLFMAGNQFRALPDLLAAWQRTGGSPRVFYATTPPGILIDAMDTGALGVGNLTLDVAPGRLWPDVFMAGPREHARLDKAARIAPPRPYARNRGCALLVRRGNPRGVRGVADLARDEVAVAMSSPQREPASYASYAATLAAQGGVDLPARVLAKPNTWMPNRVHHRETPQAVAQGIVDAAPLYRHLALYLAAQMPDHFEVVELPEDGNFRDDLAVAVLRDAPRPDAAAAWSEFLVGSEAAAVFRAHGFEPARV